MKFIFISLFGRFVDQRTFSTITRLGRISYRQMNLHLSSAQLMPLELRHREIDLVKETLEHRQVVPSEQDGPALSTLPPASKARWGTWGVNAMMPTCQCTCCIHDNQVEHNKLHRQDLLELCGRDDIDGKQHTIYNMVIVDRHLQKMFRTRSDFPCDATKVIPWQSRTFHLHHEAI